MFFVSHISIALVISYFIVTRFRVPNISLSLILFLSILPDIDILFRFTGIDIVHRSLTHSIVVCSIIFFIFLLKYRRSSIMVYFIAYLSHFAIGDLIVGPLNLLYPLGTFYLTGGIDFKTSEHIFVEALVLAITAIIVVAQYLSNLKRNNPFPFDYSKKLDPIFYPLLIIAIMVSLAFLLDESQKELFEFPNTLFSLFQSYDNFNAIAIVALHVTSIVMVISLWIITRRNMNPRYRHQVKKEKPSEQKL
jgi:membrane-bound metal-dependent hydrolase YbcI (DUF457 family)